MKAEAAESHRQRGVAEALQSSPAYGEVQGQARLEDRLESRGEVHRGVRQQCAYRVFSRSRCGQVPQRASTRWH